MFKRSGVLAGAIVVLIAVSIGVARAVESPLAWQSSGNPTLQKTLDLSPNTYPSESNFDCDEVTIRTSGAAIAQPDCMVNVPFGQVGSNGVVFSGSSESVPVVPERPYFGLQPIPGQNMVATYTSSSVVGVYVHFYNSIRDKLEHTQLVINGAWQYTIRGKPDFSLKDSSGKLLVVNPSAMAFSTNGAWMVADVPWQGFVRVNLATFDVQPFAPSMQQPGDYSQRTAQLAISNDGRSVVLKPSNFEEFKVYDLAKCTGGTLPVTPGSDLCNSRNYWEILSVQIPSLWIIYQPRFTNDAQISFTATYERVQGNFKAANYTLTAPGEDPNGISYLGMGDSFASGQGAFSYMDGTDTANNTCHLSSRAYAFLLRDHVLPGGQTVACSGAKTRDIIEVSNSYEGQVKDKIPKERRENLKEVLSNFTPGFLPQSEFIDKYRPEAITLGIGGNDIGFSNIVASCVSPINPENSCFHTYEDRLELAQRVNGVFDRLVSTYRTVAKPGKRVYVTGYPQIALPGGDCAANVHLDSHELRLAADLIDYLNTVIETAAGKAGVKYVNVSDAFTGHRLCETKSNDVAVNGFTVGRDDGVGSIDFIGAESYHPNVFGHDLLERTIRQRTANLTQPMPVPNPALQAPALPPSAEDPNLPRSGRPINRVVTDDTMVPSLLVRGEEATLLVDKLTAVLRPTTVYSLVLHSTPLLLRTATTDAMGNLESTIQIPAAVEPGFHTLHVYGLNMAGQPIDVYKTVYVAASEADYNGDGVPNISDPCDFILPANQDTDRDGTDDACDANIARPDVGGGAGRTTNSVTLTGNTIILTRDPP